MVDLTEPFDELLKMQKNQTGLVVVMEDSAKRKFILPPSSNDSDLPNLPYMQFNLDDKVKKRTRRTVNPICTEQYPKKECCRYPLVVDFENFGWDWIIAPKRFTANYCVGECRFAYMQRYPNTHLVQLTSPPGYPGPCCSPRKLSPISLLYFNNKYQIVISHIPAMVVDMCGCS